MSDPRHLPNAPIVEAVIDLRVEFSREVSIAEIEAIASTFDSSYAQKGFSFKSSVAFSVGENAAVTMQTPKSARLGVRLNSVDEKYVAIIAVTGFTLARLAPYENWERLLDEAMRLWQVYCDRLRPQKVIRTATRYVNNLRLPMNDGDSFEKYIEKLIEVPESLPQAVAEFVGRYVLVDRDTGNRTIVSLSYQPLPGTDIDPVILDIDAFSPREIGVGVAEIRDQLVALRDLKNRCFFGVVTNEALKLYQ